MSNIKCPFCQQELDIWHTNRVRMYACPDLTCKGYYMSATKDMWQELIKLMEDKDLSDKIGKLETELDRTRKALDDAKKWLMKIGYLNMSDHGLGSEKMMTDWCKTVALHGLKEIETALEQKD